MRIRKREKTPSISLEPEDTIVLTHRQEIVSPSGKVEVVKETKVLEAGMGHKMIIDEVVIFDVEPGDFEGATDGIGGAFLSSAKEDKKQIDDAGRTKG